MNNFEPIIAKNIEEFTKFVKERIKIMKNNDPKRFTIDKYWNYNEKIDPNFFTELKSPDVIEDEIFDDIYFYDDYIREIALDEIKNAITETKVKIPTELLNTYLDDDTEFVEECIEEFIDINYNIDNLLKNTELKINLFPYQNQNINTEGEELGTAIEALIKRYRNTKYPSYFINNENNIQLLEKTINNNQILKLLFDSQGYQFNDLADNNKCQKSPFLNSFLNEIDNIYYQAPKFLTFLIKINAQEYLDYIRNPKYKIIINPNKKISGTTGIGIFNPINGGGSLLQIQLEKPITLECKEIQIQIEERKNNYGYTVDTVYGFINSAWSENFEFTTKNKIDKNIPKV